MAPPRLRERHFNSSKVLLKPKAATGTIKYYSDFNSLKVLLKQRNWSDKKIAKEYFNSLKVLLKPFSLP